jgi:hypothetical protein
MAFSKVAALLLASSAVAQNILVPSQCEGANVPFEGFVSYSIEFAFFPDYSGTNYFHGQKQLA